MQADLCCGPPYLDRSREIVLVERAVEAPRDTSALDARVLVGRRAEQDTLRAAYERASAGVPTAVLISGEAGVGKSRLVADLMAAAAGARKLVGRCLDLGDVPPYGPIVSMLRSLVREEGVDALRLMVPPATLTELAWLLPDLGAPPVVSSCTRLFDAAVVLFEALAEQRPLVIAVEDAQWADRASWDLLTYVVLNAQNRPILLVVTHRDLPYGHSLRGPCAELCRHDRVERIELHRLGRSDVARLVAELSGAVPEPDALAELMRRTGGNPLLVEAVLTGDGGAFGRAAPLLDVLLTPIERLPAETQRVLRVVAASGREIGSELLARVSGLGADALDEVLRPAVRDGVLQPDARRFRFRYPMVTEVLYEGLLPGERSRLHRRFAEAIEEDPSLAGPERYSAVVAAARHWELAGEAGAALRLLWRGAMESRDLFRHERCLTMLRGVIELWPRAERPEAIIGVDRAAVLRATADAAIASGEPEIGMAVVEETLSTARAAQDARGAAEDLQRRATIVRHLGAGGAVDDLELALVLAPPAGTRHGRLVAALADRLRVRGDHAAARERARQAAHLAEEAGDVPARVAALIVCAGLDADGGDLASATAALHAARKAARQMPAVDLLARCYLEEARAFEAFGEYGSAVAAAQEGRRHAEDVGLPRTLGAQLAATLAAALAGTGRWSEADEVAAGALDLRPPPSYAASLLSVRGQIAAHRGDLDAAVALLGQVKGLVPDPFADPGAQFALATWEAELHLQLCEPAAALAVVGAAFAAHPPAALARRAWPLVAVGARAYTHAVRRATVPGGRPSSPARTVLDELLAAARSLDCASPVEEAWKASFEAETADRSERRDARERELAAWEETRLAHRIGWALVDSAEGLLSTADRDGAARRLRRAIEIGTSLGACPLVETARALAARARLDADETTKPPARSADADPHGLTARESDVLRLLALGRTNRQIGRELFISEKTASVHVSRILAKLGVANRGEAAAIAHRLRLVSEVA